MFDVVLIGAAAVVDDSSVVWLLSASLFELVYCSVSVKACTSATAAGFRSVYRYLLLGLK